MTDRVERFPVLIVISGPLGVGKSTAVKHLANGMDIRIAISHTTRPPRPDEVCGVDYFFVNKETFEEKSVFFAEHTTVLDHRYGIEAAQLEQPGLTVAVLTTDGWETVRKQYSDAIGIFLAPPSLDVLQRRLEARHSDDPKEVARRMKRCFRDMAAVPQYDYRVVVGNPEDTALQLNLIARAHLNRTHRKAGRVLHEAAAVPAGSVLTP